MIPQENTSTSLLTVEDLKIWVHENFKALDKLLLILATFKTPCSIRAMKSRSQEAGFRIPPNWNPSSLLSKSGGLALRSDSGWEISVRGRERITKLVGIPAINQAVSKVATDLRRELKKINNPLVHQFVEEGIKCFEYKLYRSAIVMSWVGAMAILYTLVEEHHLVKFNEVAREINKKWRDANNIDDLGKMKESEFLDRLENLSLVGKNVKNELKRCLDLRNSCGHPNSLQVGTNAAAHHIEVLLLHVFVPFN